MNEVKLFENEEFGLIRTVVIDDEPWFVGRDVAKILGYGNGNNASKSLTNALVDHVDEDDRMHIPYKEFMGYQNGDSKNINHNGATIINESGLYALIFGSKLESAKKFKRWVTSEVLPSIRKNGGYIAGQETMTDDELMEKALLVAQRKIAEREKKIAEQSAEIEIMKPKAEMCDKLLDASMLVNFRDAAKEIGISQTQFTGWLIENGYVYMTSTRELRPMEPYMKSEFFQMKPYQNPYNGYKGSRTYITGRGLAAFKKLIDTEGHNRDTMKKHGGKKSKNK